MTFKRLNVGESLPINEELAGVVPLAVRAEQDLLNADISVHGLREPVVLYKGEIVDGRCRQKACLMYGIPIDYKELDDELSIEEVISFVKSVNTRRNLTTTQRTMVAARVSLKPHNSVKSAALSWGVSDRLITNARYLETNYSVVANSLFNGKAVLIVDKHGKEVHSNKVSAVYAHYRRLEESTLEDTEFTGTGVGLSFYTQSAKDWYYSEDFSSLEYEIQAKLAELANYKFPTP